jgi:hypothetical protein
MAGYPTALSLAHGRPSDELSLAHGRPSDALSLAGKLFDANGLAQSYSTQMGLAQSKRQRVQWANYVGRVWEGRRMP